MNMKKFGAVLLAGCLFCAGMQIIPERNVSIVASAAKLESDGILNYNTDNDYAIVTGLTDEAKAEESLNLVIPDTIQADDGRILPVEEIRGYLAFVSSAAFGNMTNIESVEVGANVKKIGKLVFDGCSNLKEITLNEGLETIGQEALADCPSLETITLPSTLTNVEAEWMFHNDKNLKTVNFLGGNDLALTKTTVFFNCSSLETVTMGEGIIEIKGIFQDVTSLTDVQLSPTLRTIGLETFLRCTGLEGIDIPASVEEIGNSAFAHCKNLKTITLHEGLKTTGTYAFQDTALEEIMLPSTLETLGNNTFYTCDNLQTVTFLGMNTVISNSGIPKTAVIRGYEGSTAQAYAEEKGYTFELIDGEPDTSEPQTDEILLGDANQDGDINILDVIAINRVVLGKEVFDETARKAADVDSNDLIEAADSLAVLKYLVGLIESFTE